MTDFLRETDPTEEIADCLERHTSGKRRHIDRSELTLDDGPQLVGDSPSMQELREQISRVAKSNCNVLISGETGSGKGLIAELIHANSPRHARHLVSINCAAIPDALVESELFGYDRGAFTGAYGLRDGVLAQANRSTILMDEIGDLSLHAQAKLLHAMEHRSIRRVGGTEFAADIRILAATNQDLNKMMEEGRFRRDLFYRLAVACIEAPPLGTRTSDIPILAGHFIQDLNLRTGYHVRELSDELTNLLVCYPWPGNVRELKNLIEVCFVHMHPETPPTKLGLRDLPPDVRSRICGKSGEESVDDRDRLLAALLENDWNKTKAAKKLHGSSMTLYRKLSKYQLRGLGCNTVSRP